VRFLSELGKEGAYKTTGEGILRRWRTLQSSEALQTIVNRDGWKVLGSGHPEISWMPAYSFVNGQFPLGEAPKLQVFIHKTSAAQSEIEVTTAGKIGIQLSDAKNLKLLLNDAELTISKSGLAEADASVGAHRVTLVWDHTQPVTDKLQAELVTPAGSPAKARPVGGR
jgi:hypothetical protein